MRGYVLKVVLLAKRSNQLIYRFHQEQIFRDSMFGNTIQEVMELQKQRFPDRKLPWVQVTLSKQVSYDFIG